MKFCLKAVGSTPAQEITACLPPCCRLASPHSYVSLFLELMLSHYVLVCVYMYISIYIFMCRYIYYLTCSASLENPD